MRRVQWRRRRRLLLLAVAVLAGAIGIAAHATGLFHRTELETIDTRFSIRGAQPSRLKNFLIVGVDAQTLSYFATKRAVDDNYAADWPFPRRDEARVINALVKAGAKHIAIDIVFSNPSANPTDDYDLAEAIGRAKHVTLAATSVNPDGSTDILGGEANLRRFGRAVAADAIVRPDTDGVYRRMQYSYQGLVSFPVAIAEEATGKRYTAKLFGGDTTQVPIDFAGPPGTAPFLSFYKLFDGRFPASEVRGKTVIIGATATILKDVVPAPTSGIGSNSNLMAGSELVANAAASVIGGLPLRDGSGWINILMIVLLGSVAPILGMRGWALRALFGAVVTAALYAVAVQLTFNSGRIIALVDPEFALLIGVIGTLGVVYLSEAFERQYARSTFARFVPPEVVDQVLSSTNDDLRLAGVERVCTVMFSDLRSFTQFSESQPVERVIAVVNHYLNEMTEAILDAGGTLIAYMGDGIMAVFGAPLEQDDHADRALRAAREMIGPRLQSFNAWLTAEGYPSAFRMGVGLNTGTVMCGNVGAEQRVEYTAIGDTTNTASRLEGMTKGTGHMLFVSETTREAMASVPQDLEFVDEFEVRGREAKMRVYTVPDPSAPESA